MKKHFKILVKDLETFIKHKKIMYASDGKKRLWVTVRSGPNVERYIVEKDGASTGFTKKGDAVRFFNSL